MKVDVSRLRPLCPDCQLPLVKEGTSKRLTCPDPECPVIYVRYLRGKPWGRLIRVTRAAVPRVPPSIC